MFQPQFGASLHILKVEIGGDGQSTGFSLFFFSSLFSIMITFYSQQMLFIYGKSQNLVKSLKYTELFT